VKSISEINRKNFSENLSCLQKNNPRLYKAIIQSRREPGVQKTSSGALTLKLGSLYIESKYDPERDARRWLMNNEVKESDLLFFLGSGLGYHVNALLKNTNRRGVLIEYDMEIFRATLYIIEPQIFLRILPLIDIEASLLKKQIGKLVFRNAAVVRQVRSIQVHKEYYEAAEKVVQSSIKESAASSHTGEKTKKLWVKNVLKNLTQVPRRYYGTRSHQTRFNGPVILIASGPFLEDSIDELKHWSNRLPVFALLPSVPYLVHQGITPDFVMSTDAGFYNRYRSLQNIELPLITTCSVDSVLLRNWEGDIFLFSHGLPIEAQFETVKRLSVTVPMQGTSSIVMILLARLFGFTRIYLAGFDFALDGIKDHHRGAGFDSYFYSIATRLNTRDTITARRLRNEELRAVRDSSGRYVYSTHKLILYRNWLEQEISHEDLARLNRGISIRTIKQVSPGTLDQYTDKCKENFLMKVKRIEKQEITKEQIFSDLERIKALLPHTTAGIDETTLSQVYELFYGGNSEARDSREKKDDALFMLRIFQESCHRMERS